MEKIKQSLFGILWVNLSLVITSLQGCPLVPADLCSSNYFDYNDSARPNPIRSSISSPDLPYFLDPYMLPYLTEAKNPENHFQEGGYAIEDKAWIGFPTLFFNMVSNPTGRIHLHPSGDPDSRIRDHDTIPLLSFFKRINFPSIRWPSFRSHETKSLIPWQNSSALLPDSKSYRNPSPCLVDFEGFDPLLRKRKKELSYETLFSYTSPNIKPYLPGQDLLYTDARLVKLSGGYIYLSLRFTWKAKNPDTAYGQLKAQSAIRCRLTDDKSVTLYNNGPSFWQFDQSQDQHILIAHFPLHPKQVKLLEKYPLTDMRIYWSTGYEDYPIYPINFFIKQLQCLE